MINIKEGRVCIRCGLSKKWEEFHFKKGSKFGHKSQCITCDNAIDSIKRNMQVEDPSPVVVSNFKLLKPKEPEKIVHLNTKKWEEEKIENYWENENKFGEVIRIGENPVKDIFDKIK